ncbi:MAG: ribonuclease III [Omnitrophica bacterium GWA2_52_8]|nr:MAG: ribonuclease III [Omnitrophica bacterium GWA2_52_8]
MRKKTHPDPVLRAQKELRLPFRRSALLKAALIHPSYRNENRCGKLENFDRLEFFGDSILNYVVCLKLFESFPDSDEGFLSRLRSILVSRKILSRIAKKIRLSRHIRLGRSLQHDKSALKNKILADSLEALIAAYYFDRGIKKTSHWILKLYDGLFNARKLLRIDPNPKSTLQEIAQKNWQCLPVYASEITSRGIQTVVSIGAARKATAAAKTKRDSEEKAARHLIQKIRQELLARSKRRSSSGKKLSKVA